MKPDFRTCVAVALTLAALAALTGCANGYRATRTDHHAVEHIAGTPIVINTRNGQVRVIGDTSLEEIEIEATINAGGRSNNDAEDRLARTRLEIVRDTSGALTIASAFPTPHRSRDSAAITVRIPDASSVKITTSNGRITAIGMNAPLTAATSNGRITVQDWTGATNLTTSNGRVTVSTLAGELTVRTSNGRVQINDLDGPADVQTSNGRISLTLLPDQSGPINLRTTNSAITAEIGPAFIGQMTMRTTNSSISIDDAASIITSRSLERRRGELHFTDGGPTSKLQTTNGRITVRTRN